VSESKDTLHPRRIFLVKGFQRARVTSTPRRAVAAVRLAVPGPQPPGPRAVPVRRPRDAPGVVTDAAVRGERPLRVGDVIQQDQVLAGVEQGVGEKRANWWMR